MAKSTARPSSTAWSGSTSTIPSGSKSTIRLRPKPSPIGTYVMEELGIRLERKRFLIITNGSPLELK